MAGPLRLPRRHHRADTTASEELDDFERQEEALIKQKNAASRDDALDVSPFGDDDLVISKRARIWFRAPRKRATSVDNDKELVGRETFVAREGFRSQSTVGRLVAPAFEAISCKDGNADSQLV